MVTRARNTPAKPATRPGKAPAAPRPTAGTPTPPRASQGLPVGFLEVEVLRAFFDHLAVKVHPKQVIRLPRDFAMRMVETGMALPTEIANRV